MSVFVIVESAYKEKCRSEKQRRSYSFGKKGIKTTATAAPAATAAAAATPAHLFLLSSEQNSHFQKNSPHVAFCGYSIPHPSEAVVNLRIQTTGEVSAAQALRQAAADLKAASATMRHTFSEALASGEGGAPIAGAPPKVVLAASKAR